MARLPDPDLKPASTALLVVDMQYGDAHPDFGPIKARRETGETESADYYAGRLETLVIPNIRRLQEACRAAGIEVIHTKISSQTLDGRDRSLEHKRSGIHFPPGSKEAEILEELAPAADEIVLAKTCSGVFNGTNIEYLLRNLGIAELIVVGVVTGSCVEMAVRDAADRGFAVVLVEDATATWSEDMQAAALRVMSDRYAKVMTTVELINQLSG
jgi:nicotinamidase-related amidase